MTFTKWIETVAIVISDVAHYSQIILNGLKEFHYGFSKEYSKMNSLCLFSFFFAVNEILTKISYDYQKLSVCQDYTSKRKYG